MKCLPHEYYDENMLHAMLIAEIANFDECVGKTERFLPYIDNWAVCDSLSPKIFAKEKELILEKINIWIQSEHAYTVRFGVGMLMKHFLDKDFKKEYAEIVLNIKSEEYYVRMMCAWFFATALAKKWEDIIPYFQEKRLDAWVHNKAVQKACESRRITEEQKEYLKSIKILNDKGEN